jgi:hypothetical protein
MEFARSGYLLLCFFIWHIEKVFKAAWAASAEWNPKGSKTSNPLGERPFTHARASLSYLEIRFEARVADAVIIGDKRLGEGCGLSIVNE